MGCGSSQEISHDSPPGRPQNSAAAAQVPGQHQQYQQQPQLPPQQQFQGQRQPQQGLQQPLARSMPSPASPNSVSSEVQALSAPGAWPKVARVGTAPFTVSIHAHMFTSPPNQMPCWTYISQGLSMVSQPEVVFTLLRRPSENVEAFPESPLEWINTVYDLAHGGLHLETGEMVDLVLDQEEAFLKINQVMIIQDPKKWQPMSRFGSFVLGIPLNSGCFQFLNDMLPPNAHHVIALTHEETAVAKQFGVTRVIGHLGLSVRWFPYPPWIDRDRGDAVNLADQGGSIRIGMPILRLYGLNAMLVEDDIVLTIPVGDNKRKSLKDYVLGLPMSAAVGLDSFITQEADGELTWKSGQKYPMGMASTSRKMKNLNLGFLMFIPQRDKDHCMMCEDGYGILIRDDTWKAIRDAIQNAQDITIPLEDDKRFILQWKHSVFHNPIDGGEYTASWCTYRSSGPPNPPSNSHVDISQTVFLIDPPGGSIDTEELVDYIQQIHKVVEQQIPPQPLPAPPGSTHPGRQAVIEIELPKCEGWLKMTAYPSMDGLDIQGIMGRVGALMAPESRAVAKFQLFFNLWGYQQPTAQFA
ncbi:hypothetical protein BGZ57DRAFT_140114 [Hyaloscypha finlandica]|nr:hypothetical protein BGZ57DRAFT_140114 [Hyaloscypha finlandica]